MKRIYSISTLFLLFIGGNAQTYFFEDFTSTTGALSDNNAWTTQVVVPSASGLDWENFAGMLAAVTNFTGGSNEQMETWLITPAVNLTSATSPILCFDNVTRYSGPVLEVLISTDYDGTSDPTMQGTWTNITSLCNMDVDDGTWTLIYSGNVDLTAYIAPNFYLAFKYTGTNSSGATWEIDNVNIREAGVGVKELVSVMNSISLYPNPSSGVVFLSNPEHLAIDEIAVYSVTGQLLNTIQGKLITERIVLEKLNAGSYYLIVTGQDAQSTIRFQVLDY